MHTGVWSGGMEKQLFWDSSCGELHDGEHLDLLLLKCSGHSSLVLLWKGHKNNTFLIPDNCTMTFRSDGALWNFFFFGKSVPCHSIDCLLK
jgi:hypothetical protein